MDKLEYLELDNYDSGAPDIIWLLLHGLGASGGDFRDLPAAMPLGGKKVKFILPHAPVIPVAINNRMPMPAWYDILSMDFEREFNQVSVTNSLKLIIDLYQVITNKFQKTNPSVFVGGFSQGGAMAMEVAREIVEKDLNNGSHPLAGVMVLSSYLLYPDKILGSGKVEELKKLPIFMGHGTEDAVVPYKLGKKHYELLQEFDVVWREYVMPHSLCSEEIADISDWMLEQE